MDHVEGVKIIVNVHRQCCFASIIVNGVNMEPKSMNLKGESVDDHRQCASSINPPFLIGRGC